MSDDRDDFTGDLGYLDGAYDAESARPEGGGWSETVPDGRYQEKILKARLLKSQKQEIPVLEFETQILSAEGSYGKPLSELFGKKTKISRVLTSNTMGLLKTDLARLGVEIPPSRLRANLARFAGIVIEVQRKTNGARQNTYINRRITQTKPVEPPQVDNPESSTKEDPPQSLRDEDVPF